MSATGAALEMESLTQKLGSQVNNCSDRNEVVLNGPTLNGNGHLSNGYHNKRQLNGNNNQPPLDIV